MWQETAVGGEKPHKFASFEKKNYAALESAVGKARPTTEEHTYLKTKNLR